MSCSTCHCIDLGCFDRCDTVMLPLYSPVDGEVDVTIYTGTFATFLARRSYVAGDQLRIDLRAIGQLGRFRAMVLGSCFEFNVKTINQA